MKNRNRIDVLDGFRAIAILAVVLDYYFYRWNDANYPYFGGDFFHYGYKGVMFFFMISGFVICYTLAISKDLIIFFKKRFIRLFPSILIASLATFVLIVTFDLQNIFPKSHHIRNLLTSITFLPPNLYNWLFGLKNHFNYLNYSYWSLWPEIQFYILVGSVYFFNEKNFKKNIIIVSILLITILNILQIINLHKITYVKKFFNLFNLIKFLPLFLSGAIFYMLYEKVKYKYLNIVLLLFLFALLNKNMNITDLIIYSAMFLLFSFLIFRPQAFWVFKNKILTQIGIASYYLYLILEYIGGVFIKNYVGYFYPHSYIVPILVIICMILISIMYTKTIEIKFHSFLKKYFLKKK